MVHILSIDGGGIRGIVSAIVLQKLEQLLVYCSGDPNARLAQYFDLIAGTSTGAILAAIYLCPDNQGSFRYRADDAVALFLEHGSHIFQKRLLWPLSTGAGLFSTKYTNRNLKRYLHTYLGDITLAQLNKPCLLTAYDTHRCQTVLFNTISAQKSAHKTCLLKDAVLASAAAPTYFPAVCIRNGAGERCSLIDGGVFANNPSMCALTEAAKLDCFGNLKDASVCSVGNLSRKQPLLFRQTKRAGIVYWGRHILPILMDADAQTVDYQLRTIFDALERPEQYLRIVCQQPLGSADIPALDDVSPTSIARLQSVGQQLASSYEDALLTLAIRLTDCKAHRKTNRRRHV